MALSPAELEIIKMDEEIIRDAEDHLKKCHQGFHFGRVLAPNCPYYIVNIGENGNKKPEWFEWDWKRHIERLRK